MGINADTPTGLNIGDNVAIVISGNKYYYEILNRDTVFYRDSHSALATGSTESYAEITNLNPPIAQLYQVYGIGVDGNVLVYIKQPAATNRWGTQRSPTGGLLSDRISPIDDPMAVNLWMIQDYPPSIQLVNGTDVSISTTLWWFGWRYQLKKLLAAPMIYSTVNIGGLSQ